MRANDPATVLSERVDRSGGPDACWPWTGYRSPRGYGRVSVRQKDWRTHRLAWIVWVGPIPDDLEVLHRCDNPPCCNPSHLWLGTCLDNQRDKWAKGRGVINAPCGEDAGGSKLTSAQVLEIRQRYAAGESSVQLEGDYGVDRGTIIAAASGATWSHLPSAVQPRPASACKLTAEQEAEICAVAPYWGVNAALAKQYGIAEPTVAHIRKRAGMPSSRTQASSKFRGVSWQRKTGKWAAYVQINRQQHNLGLFDDEQEAAAVAASARSKYGLSQ